MNPLRDQAKLGGSIKNHDNIHNKLRRVCVVKCRVAKIFENMFKHLTMLMLHTLKLTQQI